LAGAGFFRRIKRYDKGKQQGHENTENKKEVWEGSQGEYGEQNKQEG
jgi:hypothetical protein